MKIKSGILAAVILLSVGIFSYYNTFYSYEYFLQDSLMQSKSSNNTQICIIAIDEDSQDKLGLWPWPRKVMAELINKISQGKPAVIGIDVIISQQSSDPDGDKALVEAVKNAGNVVLPVVGWKGVERKFSNLKDGSPDLETPFPELNKYAITGHINTLVDSDKIIRKTLNSFTYKDREVKSFDWAIFNEYIKKKTGSDADITIKEDKYNTSNISFVGKPDTYDHPSFYSVLNGDIPSDWFEGKIVLIGPYATGMMDSYLTPLDRNVAMNGVEIHANIIQNYIENSFKINVPDIVNVVAVLVLGLLLYLVFKRISPAKSVLILLAFVIFYMLFAKFLYKQGYIIYLFYPILSAVLIYLMTIVYRYIHERVERKRITDAFGKYVAPQVVKQILDSGEEGLKLGGVRREITTLFVDIRGFTPMSEKCEPEEVVAILNDYLNLCAESIFKYGGTLDKFIGDATMAIFNAPLDLEDHAFKAVQTAWAMKEGSEALRKGLEQKYGRSVQFGIGINTGHAVVGNIGAKFRMDYTAIGDNVNVAARLESNSKPGQIIMSQATYDLVKDRVQTTPLGEIKVKGREQDIPIYQLDGIKV